jgi:hypothetical protein
MKQDWRIDPNLLLLFAGLIFFTAVLIFVELKFQNDGQVFQVIAGLITGFAGCFFGRMDPKKKEPNDTQGPDKP